MDKLIYAFRVIAWSFISAVLILITCLLAGKEIMSIPLTIVVLLCIFVGMWLFFGSEVIKDLENTENNKKHK